MKGFNWISVTKDKQTAFANCHRARYEVDLNLETFIIIIYTNATGHETRHNIKKTTDGIHLVKGKQCQLKMKLSYRKRKANGGKTTKFFFLGCNLMSILI